MNEIDKAVQKVEEGDWDTVIVEWRGLVYFLAVPSGGHLPPVGEPAELMTGPNRANSTRLPQNLQCYREGRVVAGPFPRNRLGVRVLLDKARDYYQTLEVGWYVCLQEHRKTFKSAPFGEWKVSDTAVPRPRGFHFTFACGPFALRKQAEAAMQAVRERWGDDPLESRGSSDFLDTCPVRPGVTLNEWTPPLKQLQLT